MTTKITIGVLALQGAFHEHITLLKTASLAIPASSNTTWSFVEVRTAAELSQCGALVIPGGESTTMSLVASRSGLLEPLRQFVKVLRRPTWGTCAGLILLAESANRTKKGGQDLIGGLDVRVNRNHFGRQTESFETDLELPFLSRKSSEAAERPFRGIFIRAPIVEKVLPVKEGVQDEEEKREDTVVAPSREAAGGVAKSVVMKPVEVMGTLPDRRSKDVVEKEADKEAGDIIAVRQGNVFGTSFHPELTSDARIHAWWLQQVKEAIEAQ